jgi:hypothetical protein
VLELRGLGAIIELAQASDTGPLRAGLLVWRTKIFAVGSHLTLVVRHSRISFPTIPDRVQRGGPVARDDGRDDYLDEQQRNANRGRGTRSPNRFRLLT